MSDVPWFPQKNIFFRVGQNEPSYDPKPLGHRMPESSELLKVAQSLAQAMEQPVVNYAHHAALTALTREVAALTREVATLRQSRKATFNATLSVLPDPLKIRNGYIPVVVEREEDGACHAHFSEARLYGWGDSDVEAIAHLAEIIHEMFVIAEDKILGGVMAQQWRVLDAWIDRGSMKGPRE